MYAVVTGASSGFGIEFARQFAKRKYNLCIAARREQNLKSLKSELEKEYGITVDILPVDLSEEIGIEKLYAFTKDKNVDVLINNAGIATGGMPGHVDVAEEIKMLNINVKALHILTRLYLNDMIAKNSGHILNVSSLSGWLPVPAVSAYAAGKAYVLHLSEGINFELKQMKSKVRVSVVTPGFFNTEIAGAQCTIKDQHRSVSDFIEKVVRQFLKGKDVIIVGRDNRITFLRRCFLRRYAILFLYHFVIRCLSYGNSKDV